MFDEKKIGNKLRLIRKKNGYTQELLAEQLNWSDRIKVSRIENGHQSMTANELIKFCQLFKISLDNLIDDVPLSSGDFESIAMRYIDNETIDIEEQKELIKKLYLKLADKELSSIGMYTKTNKQSKNIKKCSNNVIEKYEIDDILTSKRLKNEYN